MATGASARTGAPSGGGHSTSAALVSGRLAGEELERVDRALAAGDAAGAALRLSVLLRLDPALAPVILSAADRALAASIPSGQTASTLHLVRGDAYRFLGRETEAAAAYRQAHQALPPGADRGGTPGA
jgi:predicted negative regulator of RcsB-dependent stress response